jgi:hypothetical protein
MKSLGTPLRIALASALRGRILDCGSGDDLFGPILRTGGNEVVSLDMDLAALRKTPGRRVAASCAKLPFADDTFDAVWACAIIEHVAHETLPEMIRVTHVSGRVIAITPNRHSPFDCLKRMAGLSTWDSQPGHVRLYGLEELQEYGEVHGELRWLPGLGRFFWKHPRLGHVWVLDLDVTPALKEKARQKGAAS